MLIRQCREWEHASIGVSHPKAYLPQDEILKGIAKLKSEKMGNVGVNMPWWHMMAYGLTKLWTNYFRIAKNNISLWYNPYTHFKMNGTCTYHAQPPNIIMLYHHFLSWNVKSLGWVLFILVLYYPIWSKFACHKRNNSRNNRDYSLKFSNLSQFNEYGLISEPVILTTNPCTTCPVGTWLLAYPVYPLFLKPAMLVSWVSSIDILSQNLVLLQPLNPLS
jgi:hypothetical protein